MKPYLASLAAGVLVGAFYGLLNVRSPAPPVVALVGLLGILIGEQGAAYVRARMAAPSAVAIRSGGEARVTKQVAISGERRARAEAAAIRPSGRNDDGDSV